MSAGGHALIDVVAHLCVMVGHRVRSGVADPGCRWSPAWTSSCIRVGQSLLKLLALEVGEGMHSGPVARSALARASKTARASTLRGFRMNVSALRATMRRIFVASGWPHALASIGGQPVAVRGCCQILRRRGAPKATCTLLWLKQLPPRSVDRRGIGLLDQ